MATIVKIESTNIEDGYREAKVIEYGVKTADIYHPFGDDSNPPKGTTALFLETETNGDPAIIGYIDQNKLSDVGEKRLYSLDSDGNISSYMWLKNNGQLELNGNGDNVVRYTPLETELMSVISKLNIELTKIQASISSLRGAYAPSLISADFSKSKVAEVEVSK